MKKVFILCLISLMALSLNAQTDVKQVKTAKVDRKAELKAQGYVDLGLPSGTLWKDQNEDGGFFIFNLALSNGDNLPSREQIEELQNSCEWTWNGRGYKVVGPNGESIILPALGYQDCDKELRGVGMDSYVMNSHDYMGCYWSSIRSEPEYAYSLNFDSGKVHVGSSKLCYGLSVRLVRKP